MEYSRADSNLRAVVDDYALVIANISTREQQISDIDREVLSAEGRLIQRVTELLREVSERRGRVLARDFARTLAEAQLRESERGRRRERGDAADSADAGMIRPA